MKIRTTVLLKYEVPIIATIVVLFILGVIYSAFITSYLSLFIVTVSAIIAVIIVLELCIKDFIAVHQPLEENEIKQ